MADGAYRWQGHAPEPDADRVEALDAGYTEEQARAFAERPVAAAGERLDRALAAVRTGDLSAAEAGLTRLRQTLEALSPGDLEPRRGLAGLFDSRRRRLKRFRAGFTRAAADLTEVASDLAGWVDGSARRREVLDGVWTGLRDALADLDAHLVVAGRRLPAAAEEADGHPLTASRAALEACRSAVLGSLPLVRIAQNADARAADRLGGCLQGVADWREGWRQALGLSGRRPRRVRPDPERLTGLRDDLLAQTGRALGELADARARRDEVEARLGSLRAGLSPGPAARG